MTMNPDKLFDYLDGKLSPGDRAQLEEKLMSDAQLRREFAVARDIHRTGGGSREVIIPSEDPRKIARSALITRRVAAACAGLVLLNVFVGIAFIVGKNRKKENFSAKEAGIRKQLETSLGNVAKNGLPPPSFVAQDIQLTAPRAEWPQVAERVTAAATAFGGSAAKGLPAEEAMTVVVDIPTQREKEFRETVVSAAAIAPMPAVGSGTATAPAPSPNERTIVQVRIAEAAR